MAVDQPEDAPGSEDAPGRLPHDSFPMAILSAGVLFFDETGRVMLVRPTYKPDWGIPGGVVEASLGETPLQAAHREVAEELGIDVLVGPVLTIDSVPAADGHPARLAFVFDGGVLGPEQLELIRFQDGEVAETRFCDLDQVGRLLPPRLTRRVLSSIAARRGQGPWPVYLHHGN
ncbi:NUDIX hydrolase [Saccharothrix xinjiangensis]|uniref:NUDIX domain-containing protein n=1 Tax=Saccharothrix xinjiangensis TaxID=204798 RepID=A0ABV9XU32_9PSEU